MKVNLSVSFCGRKLINPLFLTSGILGTEAELLKRVAGLGAGVVTTKSCCLEERKGHENPTVLAWECGIQNAVGLTNPGVEKEVIEIKNLKKLLKNKKTKICASFFGSTIKEFVLVTKKISQAEPDFLEMNISCPNTESELGLPFAFSAADTFKLTKAVKKETKIPVIVKLASQVTDIVAIAKAAEEAGADAVSAINTVPGMIIDIEAGAPILTNKIGGLSGPAIRPIAVKSIWQLAKSLKIPLIGMGGVTYGRDVIEMIMAGATGVGIGSATYFRGIDVFKKILKEVEVWMEKEKIVNLNQIRGKAL